MNVKVDCPMCGLKKLAEDICPNCETSLFLYRTLLELPTKETNKKPSTEKWLSTIRMTIICLLMGIGFTTFVNSLLAGQKQTYSISSAASSDHESMEPDQPKLTIETLSSEDIPPEKIQTSATITQNNCGGIYYTVQKGNSLSLIAERIYGNGNSWPHILTTNPQLQGREDLLRISEVLLIPNLDKYCTSNSM